MTGGEKSGANVPSYLRPLSWDEQLARIHELRNRLPKVRRGVGLNEGLFVIRPHEARSREEWELAFELERLSGGLTDNELTPDHVVYGTSSTIRWAVRWARQVFHHHGFPSRCWIIYSKKYREWLVYDQGFVDCISTRHRADSGTRHSSNGAHLAFCFSVVKARLEPIENVIRRGMLVEAQEGSALWYANRIIGTFLRMQHYRNGRSADAWQHRRFGRTLEFLEPQHRERSKYDHLLMLECCFEIGRLWGEAALLDRVEVDALAKRREREQARANAAKAGEEAQRRAAQRREAWFAHLDRLAENKRWLLKGEALRLAEAIRRFEASLQERPDLDKLFKGRTTKWYADAMDEWRLQALDNEGESEN